MQSAICVSGSGPSLAWRRSLYACNDSEEINDRSAVGARKYSGQLDMLGSIRATAGNDVTASAYAFNARNRWGEHEARGSVYDLARKLNGAGQGTRWDHGNAGDD